MKTKISPGTVHELPEDLKQILSSDIEVNSYWEKLTPLARNEWICWIEDAKKPETRQRRIDRTQNEL